VTTARIAVSLQRVGLLVAIEGIDGSGKGTQAELLARRAEAAGHEVTSFSFPRYGDNAFSRAVADYLNGAFGAPETLPPEFPALLYAGDRFVARAELEEALAAGRLVVCDRYVASNLAHQAANARERGDELVAWIQEVEFGLYGLPRPGLTILLDMPVEAARRLVLRKARRGYTELAEDVLEASVDHLAGARRVYRSLAEGDGSWAVVEAGDGGEPLPPDEIAGAVWSLVEARL
jgi:dTMP kinase